MTAKRLVLLFLSPFAFYAVGAAMVMLFAPKNGASGCLRINDPDSASITARGCLSTTSLSEQRDSLVAAEARRANVPVDLAIAVSHVENWTGDSMAVSKAGAVGLMQVLPKYWQHEFEEECGCGSLFQRRRNACVGVHILAQFHTRYKTWGKTVRAYHGSHYRPTGVDYSDSVLDRLLP